MLSLCSAADTKEGESCSDWQGSMLRTSYHEILRILPCIDSWWGMMLACYCYVLCKYNIHHYMFYLFWLSFFALLTSDMVNFIDFDFLKVMIKKHTKLVVYLSCNILDLSIMWLSIPYHLFFWLIRSGSMLPKPVKHKRYGQKAASNKGDSFSGSFWSIYLNTRTWYASKDILTIRNILIVCLYEMQTIFFRENLLTRDEGLTKFWSMVSPFVLFAHTF
jgi:hypothetical protein